MKKVIRYLLEGNGTIPVFVEDGGYFSIAEEHVGVSIDTSKRHLPSTVKVLTRAELRARIESSMVDRDTRQPLTSEQAEVLMTEWLAAKGLTLE